MSAHALAPPSPVETTITAVLDVYRKHDNLFVFAASFLLGLGIAADIILAGLVLAQYHHYGAQMLLLLGSFALAAAVGAWVWIDAVRPAVSHVDVARWDVAGRMPSVENTEFLPPSGVI